ncbi:MAG: GNAT family N-acetyltransferase [Chryseolinea sp.]
MKFTYLDWDSKFFGKRIGRIDMESKDESDIRSITSSHTDIELFYIFDSIERQLSLSASIPGFKLVDIKVVYRLSLKDAPIRSLDHSEVKLKEYSLSYTSVELENLAYQSGEFSRFKTDSSFPATDFFRLYKEWIDGSVSKRLADVIYIATSNKQIMGMVTVKFNQQEAHIGLIAVQKHFRGMNVGTQLLEHVKKESQQRNILHIFVPTQKQNESACKFYERNGFLINNVMHIYHYWS